MFQLHLCPVLGAAIGEMMDSFDLQLAAPSPTHGARNHLGPGLFCQRQTDEGNLQRQ